MPSKKVKITKNTYKIVKVPKAKQGATPPIKPPKKRR